jgi:transposase InsO family protein
MIQPYARVNGQLSVGNDIITSEDRIVIPEALRAETLKILHETHQGVVKCLLKAQMTIWWPGITKDIRDYVDQCMPCRERRPKEVHEPLKPTELPGRPWERLAADLFEIKKKHYLCVVDYYSRWIEVRYLPTTTARSVIEKLRSIFSCHGICDELLTDNAAQFVGEEFAAFAREYKFTHNTSSPHYHQGNGAAERAVQEAKKFVVNDDPALAIMNYRSTVHSATQVSPAQALMERKLKTKLPVLPQQLLPAPVHPRKLAEADNESKSRYKQYFDRNMRDLKPLDIGQPVLIRNMTSMKNGGWSNPGTVIETDKECRTYLVQTDNNTVYRRNRQHLQPIPVVPKQEPSVDQDPVTPATETPPPRVQPSTPMKPPTPAPARRSSRIIKPVQRLIELKD